MTRKLFGSSTAVPGAPGPRILFALVALLLTVGSALPLLAATVTDIRYSSNRERTRMVLDLDSAANFTHRPLDDPPRVVVELPGSSFGSGAAPFSIGDGYVQRVRLNDLRSGKIQVVLDLEKPLDYSVLVLKGPDRIVVDVKHAGAPAPPAAAGSGSGSATRSRAPVRGITPRPPRSRPRTPARPPRPRRRRRRAFRWRFPLPPERGPG